jgi:integrase
MVGIVMAMGGGYEGAMKVTNNLALNKGLKSDGNHSAGRGVYLAVRGGSRRWVFRYTASGRRTEVPLGTYPEMTLADARNVADGLRHVHKVSKIDPRQTLKGPPSALAATFKADTIAYHEHMRREWDDEHAGIWLASMKNHVWPTLGERDTATLTVTDIVRVLEPIWAKHHATAIRIHGRIRAVIEHAAGTDDHGRFEHGNPADRALRRLPRGVAPEPNLHPAVSWEDAPALYRQLAAMNDQRATALRFLLLCCTPRAAEVVKANWDEIEERYGFDVWHVPARRMKSGKARDIPLSRAAMELLRSIRPEQASGFIFPASRAGRTMKGVFIPCIGHMGNDGMQVLLRCELGLPWTVHGMRATFRTWVTAHATTVRDHDAAEIALDHVIGNKVHRAYDRADMLPERRALAERWAAFLIS